MHGGWSGRAKNRAGQDGFREGIRSGRDLYQTDPLFALHGMLKAAELSEGARQAVLANFVAHETRDNKNVNHQMQLIQAK